MTAPAVAARRVFGLDVARAAAILLVLISHCADVFAGWYGGRPPRLLSASGFFGVELFFVLSGFLIGRLLLRAVAAGPSARGWVVFMLRRWMRTLPVYLLWLVFLALFWPPRFWEPGSAARAWHQVVRYGTLMQNLAWPMPDWFGVSWSLTIEEWFYIGFSLLLFGAVALLGRARGFWTATILFLVIPALLRWLQPDATDLDAVIRKTVILRLDAIAFGVAAAGLQLRRGIVFRHPLAALAAGLALVAALWSGWLEWALHPDLATRRVIVFDAASLGFAFCLPAACNLRRMPGRSAAARLTGAAVGAVSRQSYAIYIVHLSVLEIVGYYKEQWRAPAAAAIAVALALIWGLSAASWRWIEAPILARRPRQDSPAAPPAILAPGSVV